MSTQLFLPKFRVEECLQQVEECLRRGWTGVGFKTLDCAGTYFITADIRPVGFNGNDVDFCHHITVEAGVTAVPVSAFYQAADVTQFVRFAFCKKDALLDEAVARLERHFGRAGNAGS